MTWQDQPFSRQVTMEELVDVLHQALPKLLETGAPIGRFLWSVSDEGSVLRLDPELMSGPGRIFANALMSVKSVGYVLCNPGLTVPAEIYQRYGSEHKNIPVDEYLECIHLIIVKKGEPPYAELAFAHIKSGGGRTMDTFTREEIEADEDDLNTVVNDWFPQHE